MTSRRRAALVLGAWLLVVGLVTLSLARGLWFFGDEWSFLLTRRADLDPSVGLLAPHNEHWSTLPLLVYRAVFSVLGLDHYLVWAVLPIAVHLGACAVLFGVMLRNGIGAWPAAWVCMVMALPGTGSQNVLWVFQIGFLGSALLGLAALLVQSRPGHQGARTPLTWLALTASLTCSGMAVPMVAWVTSYVLLRRGLRAAVVVGSVPTAAYAAWYAVAGRSATSQSPPATLGEAVAWFWSFLDHVVERTLALPTGGLVVLAALGLAAVVLQRRRPPMPLLLSTGAAALVTAVMLAISRAGMEQASFTAPRYAWFGAMFLLVGVAAVLDGAAEAFRRPAHDGGGGVGPTARGPASRRGIVLVGSVGALLLAALTVHDVALARDYVRDRQANSGNLKSVLHAAQQVARGGDEVLSTQPEPTYNPDISVDALQQQAVLATVSRLPANAAGTLDARAALMTAASPSDLGLPGPVATPRFPGFDVVPDGASCARLENDAPAGIRLQTGPRGAQVELRSSEASTRTLVRTGRGASSPAERVLVAGGPTWVGTTMADVQLAVRLLPGRHEVCW